MSDPFVLCFDLLWYFGCLSVFSSWLGHFNPSVRNIEFEIDLINGFNHFVERNGVCRFGVVMRLDVYVCVRKFMLIDCLISLVILWFWRKLFIGMCKCNILESFTSVINFKTLLCFCPFLLCTYCQLIMQLLYKSWIYRQYWYTFLICDYCTPNKASKN